MIGLGLGTCYLSAFSVSEPIPGALEWVVYGVWDDSAPISDAWVDAISWIVLGQWDDAAPISGATWAAPEGSPYTIWLDSEVTL